MSKQSVDGIHLGKLRLTPEVSRSCLHLFLVALLSVSGCTKHFTSANYGNLPPRTYVSVFPYRDSVQASGFNPQSSRLEVHWWSTDPDGVVLGYLISFNRAKWTFTTNNDSVFALPLFTRDTVYTLSVAAVDNSFRGTLNVGDVVAFADANGNGVWDKGETFPSLGTSIDPDPPCIKFPIANTPPVVSFLMNSGQFSTRLDLPDTTFTVVSFGWEGTDIDGNNTITDYYIALNDTLSPSSWVELPAEAKFVTLKARTQEAPTDTSTVSCDVYANTYPAMSYAPLSATLPNMKLNSSNVIYLRAKDVAEAYSAAARMPDTTHTWFVKKPKGDVLIVNDYGSTTQSLPFYRNIFDNIGGGALKGKYDVWDIRAGTISSSPRKGALVQPCVVPSFQETLKLYKYIFWYAADNENFDIAQIAVREFRRTGGKLFMSYVVPSSADPAAVGLQMRDFTDAVDSIGSDIIVGSSSVGRPVTSTGFVWPGTSLIPTDAAEYPALVRDSTNSNPADGSKFVGNLRAIYPAVDASIVYRIESFGTYGPDNPPPVLGVMNGDRTAFLLGVPLYRFDGNSSVPSENMRAYYLIEKVFKDFGAF